MRRVVLALFCAVSACSSFATHDEMLKALASEDANARRTAADGLRSEMRSEGVNREDTISALMDAVSHEYNSLALGAELIALGTSGAPEAGDPICHYVHSRDPDIQHWATKAFYLWLPRNAGTGCPASEPTSN